MRKTQCDILVVGCGVIGATLARSLAASKKGASIIVLEKEASPAQHSSGRNSGVLHSGFNPEPGTLKAAFCVEGNARAREYCQKHNIPFEMCGTIVLAQNLAEAEILAELLRRGRENNVPGIKMLSQEELKQKEPYAIGKTALFSPTGSIVDAAGFVDVIVEEAKILGAQFFFNQKVKKISKTNGGFSIHTNKRDLFECKFFVNCAGLYADVLAHQLGAGLDYIIVPFRGQYYQMAQAKKIMLNSMVYPAPDLHYPFLGVHWTKTVWGDVLVGPNAVFAMGRESYSPFQINLGEIIKMALDKGFWRMMMGRDFRKMASHQLGISLSRKRFAKEAAKLISGVTPQDLAPFPKAGNRPQLIGKDGRLVEDLVVEMKENSLHVLNAVSPGLTSSLAFADYLASKI